MLVDRIIECDGDESCVGIKNVTINEPQFQGHFPGQPVMPGVLLIEGMAQTAGALCVHADAIGTPKLVYFMTINNAKFRKPVLPGDRVEFHMRKTAQKRTMWWYKGVAKVDGVVVCEAEVSAMLIADTAKPAMSDGPAARIHPSAIVEPGARSSASRRRDRPFLPCQRGSVSLGANVVASCRMSSSPATRPSARARASIPSPRSAMRRRISNIAASPPRSASAKIA